MKIRGSSCSTYKLLSRTALELHVLDSILFCLIQRLGDQNRPSDWIQIWNPNCLDLICWIKDELKKKKIIQIHKFSPIRSPNPPTWGIRPVQLMTQTARSDPYSGLVAGHTFGKPIQSDRVQVRPKPEPTHGQPYPYFSKVASSPSNLSIIFCSWLKPLHISFDFHSPRSLLSISA